MQGLKLISGTFQSTLVWKSAEYKKLFFSF